MKIIWEVQDLKAGRRVRRPDGTEIWMIGYDPSLGHDEPNRWLKISLIDGMIIKHLDADELVKSLNSSGEQPIEIMGIEGATRS